MRNCHFKAAIRLFPLLCLIAGLLAAIGARADDKPDIRALLDQALAGDHREAANRARDRYRHPKETLMFFGLKPDMTVVEIWPSRGWYSEILAPVLRDRGTYYACGWGPVGPDTPKFYAQTQRAFEAILKANPAVYGKVKLSSCLHPKTDAPAPAGTADMVLTFRNVHNWMKAGIAADMFDMFYRTLKPGGTLGVVEHRARPGTSIADMIRTGYVTEQHVIDLAKAAGFKLVGESEINANPGDTKNYPDGVWTLPPTLRLGNKDRDHYLAIGESDRMTLKFQK